MPLLDALCCAVQALADVQEEALRKHVGIFSYGDPGDSDDE